MADGQPLVTPLEGSSSGAAVTNEEVESAEEDVSTQLDVKRISGLIKVSADKLSVKYLAGFNASWGRYGGFADDVASIQGNRPVPRKRPMYYFELTVKDAGERGTIGIGFAPRTFDLARQPGWEPNSYGYHGDDGKLFHGHGRGDRFGPTWTTGDTVGAGINNAVPEFFFTKNGELVGTFVTTLRCPLYPTIGMHSSYESVEVNFGQKPYVFDLKKLMLVEQRRIPYLIHPLLI